MIETAEIVSRLGAPYALVAAACNAALLWRALALYRLREGAENDRREAAMALFGFSIFDMFALFMAMLIEAVVR